MHPFLERLKERARAQRRRIIFTDGDDPQVVKAARRLHQEGLVHPILISRHSVLEIESVSPGSSPRLNHYAAYFYERRAASGLSESEAESMTRKPLYFGNLATACEDADACVGGMVNGAADTVRASMETIGNAPGTHTVSSVSVICHADPPQGQRDASLFVDCGFCIHPSAVQLADIVIASAGSARLFFEVEPRIAIVGADHLPQALQLVRERAPDLCLVGDLDSHPNTVISQSSIAHMPYLHQGAVAVGPLLQGLAKPVSYISPGTSAEQIYNAALLAAYQTAAQASPRS